MTPEEKAGQLTQYFYVRRLPQSDGDVRRRRAARAGEVGSLLFVTDPAEINRLQRLAVEGIAAQASRCCSASTSSTGSARSSRCRSRSRRRGIPATVEHGAGGRGPRGARGRHPLDLRADGRHRARPALGPDRSKARARTRTSARRSRPRRCAASRAPTIGIAGARARRAEALRRLRRGLGGRDYDAADIADSELYNVYLPPFEAAVTAGAGNVMTRLHGPQRRPRDRQPLAVHRRAARRPGGSRASW